MRHDGADNEVETEVVAAEGKKGVNARVKSWVELKRGVKVMIGSGESYRNSE